MRANPYETERLLHEYLLFHYAEPAELCPFPFVPRGLLRFHERIRRECLLPLPSGQSTRALDLGCAVGRFTFELGRVADEVLGMDSSRSFIRAAERMARERRVAVQVKISGAEVQRRTLRLPKALWTSKVCFRQGDAAALNGLPPGGFHLIAAINLLCRLPHPRRFLSDLHRWLVPGGQLVLATPLSWEEAYTAPREWVSDAELERLLRPQFKLACRRDLPFVIREHRRKYQLGVSTVRVFVRRPRRGRTRGPSANRPGDS